MTGRSCPSAPRLVLRPQLPSYLLIVLGCYALLSIGSALVTFGDCDAAHLEVQQVRWFDSRRIRSPSQGERGGIEAMGAPALHVSVECPPPPPRSQQVEEAKAFYRSHGLKIDS